MLISAPTARLHGARAFVLFFSLLIAACSSPQGAQPEATERDLDTTAPELPPPVEQVTDWVSAALAPLSNSAAPSQNFDLTHWKLTLPNAQEIPAAQLSSGWQQSPAFYTDPLTGGMVFRCPNIGQTTTNSKYSRSELREMRAPEGPASSPANNWLFEEGGKLRAVLRVDHVSTTGEGYKQGRFIIGQIHAVDTEVIRLLYHKKPNESTGRIYAGMDSADGEDNFYTEDIVGNANGAGIPLGEVFSYEIRLVQGLLTVKIVRASGATTTFARSVDPNYAGRLMYFKAGAYNQNNTGNSSDYVQATFFALRATH